MAESARALRAKALLGIDLDDETISLGSGNRLMVSPAGTAVYC